jgi:tetratricopeptide (TPR) repeat protein
MKFTISFTSIIILTFTTLVACNVGKKEQLPVVATDTISNQNEKMSITQMFRENGHLPMEQRIEQFYELKKQHPTAYDFENEDALNFYGYQLLWNNDDQDAFLIFKLIVSEFPESSNAYDSFGEINLKLGNKEQALLNYKKSLALNPENFNAEDQIAYILDPN